MNTTRPRNVIDAAIVYSKFQVESSNATHASTEVIINIFIFNSCFSLILLFNIMYIFLTKEKAIPMRIDRDVNASRNICHLLINKLFGLERPEYLLRKKKSKSSSAATASSSSSSSDSETNSDSESDSDSDDSESNKQTLLEARSPSGCFRTP